MDKYPQLKLDNQICFPLYACSKEIVRRYTPFLNDLGLTYTQYIVMMVMWEKETITVKALGEKLMLDSGTLTPVVRKLETKGYVRKERSREDERIVILSLTKEGAKLADKAKDIPMKLGGCLEMDKEEAFQLYTLLHKLMDILK